MIARLRKEAILARTLLEGEPDLAAAADRLSDRIGASLGLRMTVIAADGTVLGDTDLDGPALAAAENHADRPEIIAALRDGSGIAIRDSRTIGERLLYVAIRIEPGGDRRGVVRLAVDLTAVHGAQEAIRLPILTAALLAIGAATLLGHLAARRHAFRLRLLSSAASDIAAGGTATRVAIAGQDEVTDLGASLNRMAERLEERLELLTRERHRLRTLLDGMVEGVLLTDASGRILLANGAFERIFRARPPVEGRRPLETARIPALQDAIDSAMRGDRPITREIDLGGDADQVIRASLAPIREAGESRGVVGVFHDVTELKRLERVRKEFVANVSHELRTPLTAIKGYAETLRDGALNDPRQAAEFVQVIDRHADRLRTMIEELLDLSAIEHGKVRPEIVPVAILDAVQQAVGVIRGMAEEKNQTIAIDIPAGTPEVLADRQRLPQVIINLLDNAVKFTPVGGRIEIAAGRRGDKLVLAVADTGIGIPRAEQGRIFERFYRVEASRDRREGGTGLGLAIARHLVQAMGGTIEVESHEGKGTTFRVALPLAAGSRHATAT
jgi:two-component system phosphate regulon sensor histidine kinase PhoR